MVRNRASWRRPLVAYPSDLSLRSDASGQSGAAGQPGAYFVQQVPMAVPAIYGPRFKSSSPATSSGLLLSPWTPLYFSDLSSVRYPSSGERSYPTPPGFTQLRSVHERYSQELPPLRAIHEESQQGFIPVHPARETAVPSQHRAVATSKGRLLPPRHARLARSAPELDHLDRSPESRSSSSGFGSKNTSGGQNQSSHSGSTFIEWRLPPYRPPPPAPHQASAAALLLPPPPPPPLVTHWLELAASSSSPSDGPFKGVDVGSVDGHYEFDPSTPTPTPSTPTGSRDVDLKGYAAATATGRGRYDNIDARVQAMKEEFNEFRKRQANRRRSHVVVESAC